MEANKAKQELRNRIRERKIQLKALTTTEGLSVMFAFYEEVRARNCRVEDDGDMLLFQWGTYDWGDGEFFQLDITRQFITSENADDDDILQLSLKFSFPPSDAFRSVGMGNQWCSSPDELGAFQAFVTTHPAFHLAHAATPQLVTLRLIHV